MLTAVEHSLQAMLAGYLTVSETLVGTVRVIKKQRHLQLSGQRAPQVAIKDAEAAALELSVASVIKPGQTGRGAADLRT